MNATGPLDGWAPGPVTAVDRVDPWPVAAFSALLDLPAPAAGPGEPLPPLWHWFSFLDPPAAPRSARTATRPRGRSCRRCRTGGG